MIKHVFGGWLSPMRCHDDATLTQLVVVRCVGGVFHGQIKNAIPLLCDLALDRPAELAYAVRVKLSFSGIIKRWYHTTHHLGQIFISFVADTIFSPGFSTIACVWEMYSLTLKPSLSIASSISAS